MFKYYNNNKTYTPPWASGPSPRARPPRSPCPEARLLAAHSHTPKTSTRSHRHYQSS